MRREQLTYLSIEKLANLESCIRDVNASCVPGDVHEAGVALGGSGIMLATLMGAGRRFHGYDVFGQIPAPSERDPEDAHMRYAVINSGKARGIAGDPYYGYVPDLYKEVVSAFERHRVAPGPRVYLHRGLFEETLDPDGPVALAHIDCDWHDPVWLCLERIYPRLSVGGYLVLDDYNDYGGCRLAVDKFLSTIRDLEVVASRPNLVLRRTCSYS